MKRSARKAKFRLQGMRVHEVGLVDRPANLEPFLLTKGDGAPPTTETSKDAAPPPPPAAPVAAADPAAPPAPAPTEAPPGELGPMTAAAKQSVIDACGQIVESAQALAMAAGAAPTDEAAQTPPALVAGLSAMAGSIVDLCVTLDPNYVEMARKPKEPPAPPGAPPPAPPVQDEMAKSLASIASVLGELKTALEKNAGDTKSAVDALAVAVKASAVRKAIREIPAGNGQPPENAPVIETRKGAGEGRWPLDLAEDVRAEGQGADR